MRSRSDSAGVSRKRTPCQFAEQLRTIMADALSSENRLLCKIIRNINFYYEQ